MLNISLYAIALEFYAEVVLENAIVKFRTEQLRRLIDKALDDHDSEAFYQHSAELAGLGAVQAYGQVASGSKG